ncbi:BrnA antitoxin family protein [Leptolyngbya sp. GB1-A1]|uniref:hypothetical protein n=1 Tax=Leptolyngbya sp. GB1-A1 TaxID=2933908 RepID=UPI00329A7F82
MSDKNKTTKLFSFRLDVTLMEKVRQRAEQEELTVTQLVHRYLKAGVGEAPQKTNSVHSSKAAILTQLVKLLSDGEGAVPDEYSPKIQGELETITQQIENIGQQMNSLSQQVAQLTASANSNESPDLSCQPNSSSHQML